MLRDVETFEAEIKAARGGGAYVEVPAEVVASLGGGGRIPVRATFDGVEYRGSIVSMGGPTKILGMLKSIRTRLGKDIGDRVTVTALLDTKTRTVDVPDDLVAALKDAGLHGAFDALSYSHQREYVEWIEEAKRPDTRQRRIAQTLERLRED
jgi:hypothetical protein